jgi:hypothetical protein
MEAKLAFKFLVILPLILFADYLIMVLLGCTGCLFGAGDNYTCGTYCMIGKIILVVSGLFFLYLIFRDLKKLYQDRKNGKTGKEQESL